MTKSNQNNQKRLKSAPHLMLKKRKVFKICSELFQMKNSQKTVETLSSCSYSSQISRPSWKCSKVLHAFIGCKANLLGFLDSTKTYKTQKCIFGLTSTFHKLRALTSLHYFPLRALTQLHRSGIDRLDNLRWMTILRITQITLRDWNPFYRDVYRNGAAQRTFHAQYFHAASLIFQVSIKISLQFSGFSEQHQENQNRITREVL